VNVVNGYTYFGFTFTTKLSYREGTSIFVAKGKKTVSINVNLDEAKGLNKANMTGFFFSSFGWLCVAVYFNSFVVVVCCCCLFVCLFVVLVVCCFCVSIKWNLAFACLNNKQGTCSGKCNLDIFIHSLIHST